MTKRETYPEYLKRRDASNPKGAARRKAAKALMKKNFSILAKDKSRG